MIKVGPSGRVAHYFLNNRLTLLFIITALLAGVFAVMMTPREEEPQIQVPMVDLFLPMPGATPQEVEQRVVTPMEKRLWEIPGVEYVYSTSSANMGMVIVRFKVGTNPDSALLKIYDKVAGGLYDAPAGAMQPLIKLHGIDDVPVLGVTLWGKGYDAYTLTRLGHELELQLRAVPDVAQVEVLGAQEREVRVVLDPVRMAAHGVNPLSIAQSLGAFNSRLPAGSLVKDGKEIRLEVGSWLKNKEDVGSVLVSFAGGRPVYLGDVATVEDGPPVPGQYVLFGVGPAASVKGIPKDAYGQFPAVTVSVAKRPGVNASALNELLLEKVEGLKRQAPAQRPERDGDAQLRRDGGGEVQRAHQAPHPGHPRGGAAHRVHAGVEGIPRGGHRRARHPRPHAAHLLPERLHAQPRHPVRPHLLHRHPGGRRHRGRGEHLPALHHERRPEPDAQGHRGRGRGGQPHDPRHLHGHRRHPPHGLRARHDGALHAPHPRGRQRRHAHLPRRRLHGLALGRLPPSQVPRPAPRGRRGREGRHGQAPQHLPEGHDAPHPRHQEGGHLPRWSPWSSSSPPWRSWSSRS